jgi:hypothetical protein
MESRGGARVLASLVGTKRNISSPLLCFGSDQPAGEAARFYVLMEGRCNAVSNGGPAKVLRVGDTIGSKAMFHSNLYPTTVEAVTGAWPILHCEVMKWERATIPGGLGRMPGPFCQPRQKL